MLAFALLTAGAAPPRTEPIASATFQAVDTEIANPERGFYRPLTSDLAHLTAGEVQRAYADGVRLMYARIDLSAYRQADLPADVLAQLDAGFAEARRGGVKLIVRAVYNYPRGETAYRQAQDAPLDRVLRHLAQLKPVWLRNADVIAFVQAGFVGAWGEWHTSSNALAEPLARTRIKDALLDTVPAGRSVQFRYPPYIMQWMPSPPAAPAMSRVGYHNDCFLASATDVGTFDDDPAKRLEQQRYLDRLGDVAPFGGETCNPADDPGAVPRTGCDAILAEGARYNLTYLNASYYRTLFHDRWTADGCMAEVRRRMGYRIALVRVSHPAVGKPGGTLAVTLAVRNTGWARLYNPRGVELLLRAKGTGEVRRLRASGTDPRTWLPAVETAETLGVALPSELASGVYDVLLALPDIDPRLAGDPRYAIRLANADDRGRGQGWDATLGAFALGTTIEVR